MANKGDILHVERCHFNGIQWCSVSNVLSPILSVSWMLLSSISKTNVTWYSTFYIEKNTYNTNKSGSPIKMAHPMDIGPFETSGALMFIQTIVYPFMIITLLFGIFEAVLIVARVKWKKEITSLYPNVDDNVHTVSGFWLPVTRKLLGIFLWYCMYNDICSRFYIIICYLSWKGSIICC